MSCSTINSGLPYWGSGNGTNAQITSQKSLYLSGGSAGQIPYQTSSGLTSFASAGSSGQLFISGGTGAPTFSYDAKGDTSGLDPTLASAKGEFSSQVLTSANAVVLTSGAANAFYVITLPAGDWDVRGQVNYKAAATTSITQIKQGISTSGSGFGGQDTYSLDVFSAVIPTTSVDIGKPIRPQRLLLTTSTNVYLVAQATFTVAGLSVYGTIEARRIR
jgi:hypothetical protein